MSTQKKFSVKKTEKLTEQRAVEMAMKKMQTFETNLTPEHTETHYVFRRIR